jgi:Mrp family chromosome partitioning ATPase
MTLAQYLIALVKRWKTIVACIVLLGVAAYAGSKLMTPIYQSAAAVQIGFSSGNNQSDYTSLLAGGLLAQTEATLATSDSVLREVASRYPGLTAGGLAKEVTAMPKTNTQLFEIDVRDPSPKRAAALANDIANTLIQQQIQVEQQSSAQTGSFLVLIQPAQPPLEPVQPNIPFNTAIGLMAGLVLGIALALLFEQLDTHVATPEALTQLLGFPVLATITQAGPKEEVVNPTGHNPNVESYHILRTKLGFSAIDKPLRTLIVTSASPGDGKTVTAANLAIFMAKAGKITLLIDGNLRRPILHEMFDLPAETMGFSNAILAFSTQPALNTHASQQTLTPTTSPSPSKALPATTVSLDPFFHAVGIPNLCVMPSGPLPLNPPELLDSKAMQRLLAALGSCGAEVVIFDTPPLLGLSDASILASEADGTLVVVDITRADKGHLKQLETILAEAGADVLGCVVNKQRRSRHHAIYSSYYTDDAQTVSNRHSRKNKHTAPVTPDIVKEPKTQPEEDLSDSTVKTASVDPMEGNTQSQPDPPDDKTVILPSAYSVRPKTLPRPDLLDGRKTQSDEGLSDDMTVIVVRPKALPRPDLLDEGKNGLRENGR